MNKIGTYNVYKVSLSCFDNQLHILHDGKNSLTYLQTHTCKQTMFPFTEDI